MVPHVCWTLVETEEVWIRQLSVAKVLRIRCVPWKKNNWSIVIWSSLCLSIQRSQPKRHASLHTGFHVNKFGLWLKWVLKSCWCSSAMLMKSPMVKSIDISRMRMIYKLAYLCMFRYTCTIEICIYIYVSIYVMFVYHHVTKFKFFNKQSRKSNLF